MSGGTQTREEILREGYARFNDGEVEWLLEQVDPGVLWEDALEVPGAESYRGREEVERFLDSFKRLWERIRFEPEEIRRNGDVVACFCLLQGRGRSSGAEVSQRVGHVWEFRGDRVVHVRTFLDWQQAAEAAGVATPDA
jgi:ketosteroid isomerase-like protein